MTEIIIETMTHIAGTLLITLIGVLGTWLTSVIAKRNELAGIAAATEEAIRAAQLTVLELQQTAVGDWKAAAADGKLTQDEIQELSMLLLQKAKAQMSDPAKKLLTAAGADLNAIITAAGEAMVNQLKVESGKLKV